MELVNKDAFSGYHPVVNFIFFGLVFAFSMIFMHPVCLFISFFCSISYYILLKGKKAVGFLVKGVLPLLVLTAVINPAFNHGGVTILTYLPSGNPLTAESIWYGLAAGVMLMSVLLWFACYTEVMTSDKFLYLFGRVIPALSLVISMTLRFVPKFRTKFQEVWEVQKGLGRDISKGSFLKRMRHAVTCFSIMVTWSLENAIETGDSMKSRGYGLQKRTAYSIYRFEKRDRQAILVLLSCGLILLGGMVSGKFYWRYFPSVKGEIFDPVTVVLMILYLLLCLTPVLIDKREVRLWNLSRQNM